MEIRSRHTLLVCLTVLALAGSTTSCGFGQQEAAYSHERGTELVDDAFAGIFSSLDPRPVSPSPKHEPDTVGCAGLDGTKGLERIARGYGLGSQSPSVRDAWFNQTHEYVTTHGYEVEAFKPDPLSPEVGRLLVARHPDTQVKVTMFYHEDEGVTVGVTSGCVPENGQ
jgi:hypothetical protein